MKNTLPSRFKRLFSVAEEWIKGCLLNEVPINILHFKAAVITAARALAKAKDDVYQAAKGGKSLANAAHQEKTAEARDFVLLTREVLKPRFSKTWSPAWEGLGFTTSLRVPASSADLLPLLESLEAHFTRIPRMKWRTSA